MTSRTVDEIIRHGQLGYYNQKSKSVKKWIEFAGDQPALEKAKEYLTRYLDREKPLKYSTVRNRPNMMRRATPSIDGQWIRTFLKGYSKLLSESGISVSIA